MSAGRIESYVHSDKSSPNKGGALAAVYCDTSFAAATDEFSEFTKKVARLSYGFDTEKYCDLVAAHPSIEEDRLALSKSLKEKVEVGRVTINKVVTRTACACGHETCIK